MSGCGKDVEKPSKAIYRWPAPMGMGFPINSSCVYPLSAFCQDDCKVSQGQGPLVLSLWKDGCSESADG
jgi:hypothetical protein